jgi:hypothetical protein
MTLGGQDKKKVLILGALFAVLGYFFYDNVIAGPSVPTQAAQSNPLPNPDPDAGATRPLESPGPKTQTRRARVVAASRASREEFVPVFREKRQGQAQDAARPSFDNVDPTVHWEILAKVRDVPPAGGIRNLFEASAAPPKPVDEKPKGPEPKVFIAYGPKQPPPPAPPPPPPPPPPIPLKLYGVVTMRNTGKRTACFIDGEDIVVASEGDIVKRRYRIVSIGAKLVTVEDIEAKRQQQLTLPEDGNS